MPADVIGTNVFNLATSAFTLHRGPIFTDLLLVDEINRTTARTQAALLEAMEERQATIDGVRYSLGPNFTVFATQNPVEFEGTYPLPEAQLDRFLLKIRIDYPSAEEEAAILKRFEALTDPHLIEQVPLDPIDPALLAAARAEDRACARRARTVSIHRFASIRRTRDWPALSLGASPRAAIGLFFVARALAGMEGRDFPDSRRHQGRRARRPPASADAETGSRSRRPDGGFRDCRNSCPRSRFRSEFDGVRTFDPCQLRPRVGRIRSGWFRIGFGTRFFVALLIGLVWVVPAAWSPRFIAGMFIWDGLFLLLWLRDLLRLPKPARARTAARLAFAAFARRAFQSIRGIAQLTARRAVFARVTDETPRALRREPPVVEFAVPAGGTASAEYEILPAQRGDLAIGKLFVRYQSALAPCRALGRGGNIGERARAAQSRTSQAADAVSDSHAPGRDGAAAQAPARTRPRV